MVSTSTFQGLTLSGRTYGEKAEKNVQKYGIDTVFQALTRLYYEALTGKTDGASEEEKR